VQQLNRQDAKCAKKLRIFKGSWGRETKARS
jgi:hypothetical protein